MASIKVLLDTNVLLDYVLDRGSVSIQAEQLFEQCVRGEIECHVAAHSVVNIFYILRKYYSVATRKMILLSLCDLCFVEDITEQMIREVLQGAEQDIEDHLQILCAKAAGTDYIITRDGKGFQDSSIPAISPVEFLKKEM